MAKLTRQAQQIFAGQAPSDMIAAFGSTQTGTPVYSTDLSTLQTTNYQQGWQDAIIADKAPFLEEMNGVMYGTTYQLAYIMQQGIPEWDAGTTYYTNSRAMGSDGNIYKSLTDGNTGNNPTTDSGTNWVNDNNDTGMPIGQPQITLSNTLEANEIWLEGATVSRETYSKLFEVYGTTYGEGDGSTTFALPDFRNRAIWGSSSFGYISAGLPNIEGASGWFAGDNISGAYTKGLSKSVLNNNGRTTSEELIFDASLSNPIYGNSDTVQPPSIQVRVKTRYQ